MRNIAKKFSMKLSVIDISVIQPRYRCFYGEDIELNVSVVDEIGNPFDISSTSIRVYYQSEGCDDLIQNDGIDIVTPTIGRFNVLVKKYFLRVGLNTIRILVYDNDQEVYLQPTQVSCLETGIRG